MIPRSGVLPVRKDHRDRSYPRSFGTVSTFPDELNLDWDATQPDQNRDGLPNGCTGYTQTQICQDEDQARYDDAAFTYDKTLFMEGNQGQDVGCNIRDSLNSTIVYGVKRKQESDADALSHRRGAYYNVVDSPDLDAFDDVRSAMLSNNHSVSCATPWFDNWQHVPDGVLPAPHAIVAWHNWKICGWKQIAGEPHLIGKVWQGPGFGDRGYVYLSRAVFNAVMATSGTACFTLRKADSSDYARIRLTLLETLLSYYRMLLAKIV